MNAQQLETAYNLNKEHGGERAFRVTKNPGRGRTITATNASGGEQIFTGDFRTPRHWTLKVGDWFIAEKTWRGRTKFYRPIRYIGPVNE